MLLVKYGQNVRQKTIIESSRGKTMNHNVSPSPEDEPYYSESLGRIVPADGVLYPGYEEALREYQQQASTDSHLASDDIQPSTADMV
jgi:hypothetical protein